MDVLLNVTRKSESEKALLLYVYSFHVLFKVGKHSTRTFQFNGERAIKFVHFKAEWLLKLRLFG